MISPLTLASIARNYGGRLPDLADMSDDDLFLLCRDAMRAGPNLGGVIYLFGEFCFDALFRQDIEPVEALRRFRADVINAFESDFIDVIDNYNEADIDDN